MLDYVIKGGTIVDGTGAAPRPGDVGIRGERIVAVGEVDEPARRRSMPRASWSLPGSSIPTPTTTPSSTGTATPHRRATTA